VQGKTLPVKYNLGETIQCKLAIAKDGDVIDVSASCSEHVSIEKNTEEWLFLVDTIPHFENELR
jgi:hypothetical protein